MLRSLFDARNPLVAQASTGSRPWRRTPLWAVFFAVPLVTVATFELKTRLAYDVLFPGLEDPAAEPARAAAALFVELLLGFAVIFFLLWLWLKFFERRPFATIGFIEAERRRKALSGALVGFLVVLATIVLLLLLGHVAFEPEGHGPTGLAALPAVLFVAAGWAAQATSEEVLTRGWALQNAARRGVPFAVLFSALVHSLFHLAQPDVGPLALLNLFLFGVLLALVALEQGSIWGACALHAAFNWAETSVFGLDYYGQEAAGGVLVNLRQTGPDLFTGGGVGAGLTGGLAQTFVLVLAIGVFFAIVCPRLASPARVK